jgi:hypothetical protein
MQINMKPNNENDNPLSAQITDTNPAPTANKNRKTPEELTEALAQFSGTVNYYRYWFGIYALTDGVQYLAEEARCHWLLDAIGSYQPELAKHADQRLQEIQFWKLKVNADKSAVLTCVADAGESPAVTQRIEWTDFPLPEIDIWIGFEGEKRIALLPSEY